MSVLLLFMVLCRIHLLIESSMIPWEATDILEPFVTVGIFSKCLEHNQGKFNSENKGEFNFSSVQKVEQRIQNVLRTAKNFNYISIDVCNDTKLAHQAMIDFYLNETYYFPQYNKTLKVIALFAYVPEHLSKIIGQFSRVSSPFFICQPVECDSRFEIVKLETYTEILKDLAERFEWNNLNFISINTNNDKDNAMHQYFENSYHQFNESQEYCLSRKTLNLNISGNVYSLEAYEKSTIKLTNDYIIPLLRSVNRSGNVLFGDSTVLNALYQELRTKPEYREKILLFHNLYLCNSVCYFNSPNWLRINDARKLQSKETWFVIGSALGNFFAYLKENLPDGFRNKGTYADSLTLSHTKAFGTRQNYILPMNYFYFTPGSRTLDQRIVSTSKEFLEKAKFESLNCTEFVCPPGHYKTYGVIERSDNTERFDQVDGLKCILCGVNTIKVGYNDGLCVPCGGTLSVDNGLRTACVDPYRDIDLVFEEEQFYISVSLIIFGCVVTLSVLIIFVAKRNTPIVRANDFKLAATHLVVVLFIFPSSYYAYVYEKVNLYKCVTRSLNLSILYAFNVAFIYSKSLKVIDAFLSTVILTASEVKKTKAIQLFSIFIYLFIINGILLVLFVQYPPTVEYYVDESQLLRVHHCDVEFQGQVLMAFLMLLQIVCLVQAFRGRNLPGHMNDAMSIVYLILITTVTFAITFPISYLLDQLDKEFTHVVALTVNSVCSVVFLYGKKCYVMIAKAKKNTREYFNQKRMEAMKNEAAMAHRIRLNPIPNEVRLTWD